MTTSMRRLRAAVNSQVNATLHESPMLESQVSQQLGLTRDFLNKRNRKQSLGYNLGNAPKAIDARNRPLGAAAMDIEGPTHKKH
ncbi:MAG: hypothetical protein WCE53_16935 [Candidatus Acidiferrum sp.]